MTHDDAYQRLAELVGLRAASPNESALQTHVGECHVCQARLHDLERVSRALALARSTPFALPVDLETRVLAIPAEHPSPTTRRSSRRLLPIGVTAAAAASIAALTITLTHPGTNEPTPRFEVQQAVALHAVASDVRGTVELGKPSGQYQVVRLKVEGLPTRGNKTYDLWFVSAKGAMRVGSFGPGKDGACIVDLTTPRNGHWDRITITPTGQAPNASVLATS